MAMPSMRNSVIVRLPRVFVKYGHVTMPMLVAPSWSGMNQNQPCSNQKMVMLPSACPSWRRAPAK